MYQGGEAVSKTACGGFDSQPSVPGQGEETDDSRRFICEQIRCELVGGLLGLIRPISSKVERLAHNRLAQVRFLDGPPDTPPTGAIPGGGARGTTSPCGRTRCVSPWTSLSCALCESGRTKEIYYLADPGF